MGEDLLNQRILSELSEAVAGGIPVVLATVVGTSRSVPRHAGSKMLVFREGRTSGTIGGGEMEARVIEEALGALEDGRTRLLSYDLLDPQRGDPGVCGGNVQLFLEAYMPASTVFVVGCGHIGRAVVELAHWLGFRVVAYDDRPDLADPALLADADVVASGDLGALLDEIDGHTHVVVVTRNMEVDVRIVPRLLETQARSIGIMGSRRRWQETRTVLAGQGISDEALARLSAPIGLELNAETPEEIAVSIMSEIILGRRGGTGEAMTDAD